MNVAGNPAKGKGKGKGKGKSNKGKGSTRAKTPAIEEKPKKRRRRKNPGPSRGKRIAALLTAATVGAGATAAMSGRSGKGQMGLGAALLVGGAVAATSKKPGLGRTVGAAVAGAGAALAGAGVQQYRLDAAIETAQKAIEAGETTLEAALQDLINRFGYVEGIAGLKRQSKSEITGEEPAAVGNARQSVPAATAPSMSQMMAATDVSDFEETARRMPRRRQPRQLSFESSALGGMGLASPPVARNASFGLI